MMIGPAANFKHMDSLVMPGLVRGRRQNYTGAFFLPGTVNTSHPQAIYIEPRRHQLPASNFTTWPILEDFIVPPS